MSEEAHIKVCLTLFFLLGFLLGFVAGSPIK